MSESLQTSRIPQPTQKRPRRARTGIGLWVTDKELYEILGVPEDTARIAIADLDSKGTSGFPKPQAIWGGRRYLPAIEQWFDEAYRLRITPPGLRRAS